MNNFLILIRYCKYLWLSKTKYSVHPPYLYNLITQVFNDKRTFYAYNEIKLLLKQAAQNTQILKIIDFGAGSHTQNAATKPYNVLLKGASIPPKYGKLLFRIINHLQPKTILEIGTCLGVSSLYMGKAASDAKHITLEGNPDSAAAAEQLFAKAHLKNIKVMLGEFSSTLPLACNELKSIDFAFVDGNHKYEPTILYFNEIMKYKNNNTVIIFHDIHWSTEMEQAWNEIISHTEVSLSIDLFFMGIIYFNSDYSKQNFTVLV